MMDHFSKSFRFSFRDQLIYGIGFLLTLLLGIFIYIETTSSNNFIRSKAFIEASDHSKALASISKVWVMSNDYVGLEEVLDNFSIYNDLVFATVINMDGKIIAHTEKKYVGTYIADERRISFLQHLNQEHSPELIWRNGHFIDVIRVIHDGEDAIGLVHLRLDQHGREEQITNKIFEGIVFGLLYLIFTVLLLYLVVATFTKQLGSLLETMKRVHNGEKDIKADEGGNNELSFLSHEFNAMLNSITAGETALQAVKERLEYAVNGTKDGLWDWDLQSNEVYFSPRWKEMLGYSDDELSNVLKNWAENVHPDDLEKVKEAVAMSHKTPGQFYENIHRIRHKNGTWVWVLDRGQTIFNTEGKAIRMVGFHTDITKQKELEQELLEQEEMMIAQSRHVAMGEMIGMIAHQWRQPISGIAMEANILLLDVELDEVNNERITKKAKEILKLTEHLSKTIDDFRNFFRPNKDKDKVKMVDILLEAEQIMGKSLEHHNITLSIESDECEAISTYSREMLQVVLNLFKNAQEAIEQNTPSGGRIDAHIVDKGDSIVITVSDNGGGIEESIMNRIFEPYFSTKGKETGTGLGLYMTKTIINKHLHGSINARNTDVGVEFTLVIPKQDDEKEDHA